MPERIEKYKRVRVTWIDIQSSAEWMTELAIKKFKTATCYSEGRIYSKGKKNLKLFNDIIFEEDGTVTFGAVICIPICNIKKIENINFNQNQQP